MSVAIVDYGSGNLHSAHKALERAARETGSRLQVRLTSNPEDVRKAERIVLPGVGAFADCRRGLEHQVTEGLGWIPGEVVAIEPVDPSLKIPHMGWNTLSVRRRHSLLDGIPTGEGGLHAYFVHSFQLKPASPDLMIADTDYGAALTAIVGRDNLVGTQFHPEKSQTLGLALLRNFLQWRP